MKILTKEEVQNLPINLLPMLVFSTDLTSFLSFGVRARKHSTYSHFMWAHRPGFFASQHLWFKEVPAKDFLKKTSVLKFWTIDGISEEGKQLLIARINEELKKPKWKTRYDILAIFGQLVGFAKIQTPWTKICSEHAQYLSLVDPRYNSDDCVAPNEVNEWLKSTHGYSVYGKYYIEE